MKYLYIEEPWKNNGGGLYQIWSLKPAFVSYSIDKLQPMPIVEMARKYNDSVQIYWWDEKTGYQTDAPKDMDIKCNKIHMVLREIKEYFEKQGYIFIPKEEAEKLKSLL